MDFIFLLVTYSIYLILGILMDFMPYLTRKTESFGVTIPEDTYYCQELRNMRKKYSLQAALIYVPLTIGSIILSFNAAEERASLIYGIGLVLLIGLLFALYLKYHFQMKKFKSQKKWGEEKPKAIIIDTGFRNKKLTYSNAWFIIPTIIMMATLAVTLVYFDRIPERIPLQYNFSGEVTRWAEKSPRSVFWIPVQQLMMIGLFAFINYTISRAKQQIDPSNPEKSLVQNQIFRLRWSAYIIATGTFMVLIFTVVQLSFIFNISPQIVWSVPMVITALLVIGAAAISITTGQGGSRVVVGDGTKREEIDKDDDKYWKLGQFYFNPNDPTIFLEKRFGIGWTINFASIKAWLILLGVIGLIIGIQFLFRV